MDFISGLLISPGRHDLIWAIEDIPTKVSQLLFSHKIHIKAACGRDGEWQLSAGVTVGELVEFTN